MNEKSSVMSKVDKAYEDYGARAKELASQGKKMIGYICSFVPLEMITAAGCVPFRVRGDIREPITKGDTLHGNHRLPFHPQLFRPLREGQVRFPLRAWSFPTAATAW